MCVNCVYRHNGEINIVKNIDVHHLMLQQRGADANWGKTNDYRRGGHQVSNCETKTNDDRALGAQ